MRHGKKRSKKTDGCVFFFTCHTAACFALGKRGEMRLNVPHVLQERCKGPWRRSRPVLVLAVDVLFKTSKAHQGWLSVFLQECQAFYFSPSGGIRVRSSYLVISCRLRVNKFGGLGMFYLCAWRMCWCVMCTNKVHPPPPTVAPPSDRVLSLCGIDCMLVSVEWQQLRCGNYAWLYLNKYIFFL